VQKGKSFPTPLDMSIDGATGNVQVRYADDDGESKIESERMELPTDLANGLVSTLLKNVRPGSTVTLSYIAATPKPRLVKLEVAPAAPDGFTTGFRRRRATHYVLKVDIGGLKGVLAPLVGKQPPDSHVWILTGGVPAFVKAEQTFYTGGPVWRIEMASAAWPRASEAGVAPAKKP
jgi:hypothetical protein